jgi:hypothetical protein
VSATARRPGSCTRRARCGPARASRAACALALALATTAPAHAEFYRFTDAEGRSHVSNIPAAGFDAAGRLRPTHDPSSPVYQQRRLIERLRQGPTAQQTGGTAAGTTPATTSTAAQPRRPTTAEAVEDFERLIEMGRAIVR